MAIPDELQRYGKCLVEREIGRGARSTVYLAWHEGLQIPVAVKVLKKAGSEDAALFSERFMREARIAAQLAHPNIVRVYDCGETEDSYYLVMEYIEGESGRDRMARGVGFDWQMAARVIREVADGLNYASKKGIIHRDLKPENIMIDTEGNARITDLGLAKEVGVARASATADGDVLGTPYYMSPEQVRQPGEVDFRSDIYSLGATLYHMATGEVPFEAPTPFEIMTMHLNSSLTPPEERRPDLPEALCEVIIRTMAKEPQNRYQSYGDLIRDLDALLAGPSEVRQTVMTAVEESLDETAFDEEPAVEAPEEEEEPEPTPEPPPGPAPLRPGELLVRAADVCAKAAGVLALLVYAFLHVCLYHVLNAWAGPVAAVAATAGLVAASAAWAYAVLNRKLPDQEPPAVQALREQLSTALGWVCERLDLPVPQLRVTRRRDADCQAYRFFSGKAALYLPGEWLANMRLNDQEMRCYLAQALAGVYNGDADVRALLAMPVGLLGLGGRAAALLLRLAWWLGPLGRRRLGRGLAVLGMVAMCVLAALLLSLNVLAGVLCAAAFALLVLVAAFERNCTCASDALAAKVSEDEATVRTLVAAAGLSSIEQHHLVGDSMGQMTAQKKTPEPGSMESRRELIAKVVEHYTTTAYVPDTLELAVGLISTTPTAGERLNRLGGVPHGRPFAVVGVELAARIYDGLMGPVRSGPLTLADARSVRPYAFTGIFAGVLTVAAMAFLFLRGRGHYPEFLVMLCAMGAALGFVGAYRSCQEGLLAHKLGWGLLVSTISFTVVSMLGFCLTGWPRVADLALHFPVSLALVALLGALTSAGYVRIGPRLGVQLRRPHYGKSSETAHTVTEHGEAGDSMLRSRHEQTSHPDRKPTEGAAEAGQEDDGAP